VAKSAENLAAHALRNGLVEPLELLGILWVRRAERDVILRTLGGDSDAGAIIVLQDEAAKVAIPACGVAERLLQARGEVRHHHHGLAACVLREQLTDRTCSA
jgi:hypothetical protein